MRIQAINYVLKPFHNYSLKFSNSKAKNGLTVMGFTELPIFRNSRLVLRKAEKLLCKANGKRFIKVTLTS